MVGYMCLYADMKPDVAPLCLNRCYLHGPAVMTNEFTVPYEKVPGVLIYIVNTVHVLLYTS